VFNLLVMITDTLLYVVGRLDTNLGGLNLQFIHFSQSVSLKIKAIIYLHITVEVSLSFKKSVLIK
jgi:hypothetical protein